MEGSRAMLCSSISCLSLVFKTQSLPVLDSLQGQPTRKRLPDSLTSVAFPHLQATEAHYSPFLES